jgi:hypothetical protein
MSTDNFVTNIVVSRRRRPRFTLTILLVSRRQRYCLTPSRLAPPIGGVFIMPNMTSAPKRRLLKPVRNVPRDDFWGRQLSVDVLSYSKPFQDSDLVLTNQNSFSITWALFWYNPRSSDLEIAVDKQECMAAILCVWIGQKLKFDTTPPHHLKCNW